MSSAKVPWPLCMAWWRLWRAFAATCCEELCARGQGWDDLSQKPACVLALHPVVTTKRRQERPCCKGHNHRRTKRTRRQPSEGSSGRSIPKSLATFFGRSSSGRLQSSSNWCSRSDRADPVPATPSLHEAIPSSRLTAVRCLNRRLRWMAVLLPSAQSFHFSSISLRVQAQGLIALFLFLRS